jgi:hypothetical protein
MRRAIVSTSAIGAFVALAPTAAQAVWATSAPGWRLIFSRQYPATNRYSGFTSITAISARDAWALGARIYPAAATRSRCTGATGAGTR